MEQLRTQMVSDTVKMFGKGGVSEEQNDPRNWNSDNIGGVLPKTLKKIEPQYHPMVDQSQNVATKMYCTRVSAYKAIQHNTQTPGAIDNDFLVARAREEASAGTYTIGRGDSTLNGVKNAIKYWNENNPKNRVFFLVERLGSPACMEAIEKGYMVVASYKGRNSYHSDINKEGILNYKDHTGSIVYGHATNIVGTEAIINPQTKGYDAGEDHPGKSMVLDQFVNRWKHNTYVTDYKDLYDLVRMDTYYHNVYIILPESTLKGKTKIEDVKKLAIEQKIGLVAQNAVSVAWNYHKSPKAKKEASEYAKVVDDTVGNFRGKTEEEKILLMTRGAISLAHTHLSPEGKKLAEDLAFIIDQTGIELDS